MRGYWRKAADLATFLVRCDAPKIARDNALAVAAHLNLGNGQNGEPVETPSNRCLPDRFDGSWMGRASLALSSFSESQVS
jgi:hypothetical protein